MTTVVALVARAGAAAVLLLALGTAAGSGIVPWPVAGLAVAALVGGVWRPALALPWVLACVPWGERLAAVPVRATEAILFAFLAGWCLRLMDSVSHLAGHRVARPTSWPPSWPALTFAAIVATSAARVTLALPTGLVGPYDRLLAAVRLVPADYLITAGRAPHTAAALQLLLAAAVYLLARALVHRDQDIFRRVATTVAASGVVVALASIVSVPVVYYMTGDYNEIDRYIGATPSRGSFFLRDVNAAGSFYVLAGLASLGVSVASVWMRRLWWVGRGAIVVGIWMSGSRAAAVAGGLCAAAWCVNTWRARQGRDLPQVSRRVLAVAAVVALVGLTASARFGSNTATTGSASRSLSIRGEFLETSLRMFATAPLAGVGVGTYYQRSNAFMPPGIRALYGHENAHNYFMQVGVELGLVGLVAFLWWLGTALGRLWDGIARADGRRAGSAGLLVSSFAAGVAFLLTCVTGHPFLVIEAALPFWALLGSAVAATDSPDEA